MQTLINHAVTDQTPMRGRVAGAPVSAAQTAPRLLLADDDPVVRALLVRIAQRQGWGVAAVADGQAALAAWPLGAAAFDVVILDVYMPGLNGYETYERLVRWHPAARFVFVTGYADEAPLRRLATSPDVRVLLKPFPLDSFVTAVRGLLEG